MPSNRVFQSYTNDLYTITWLQVFLSMIRQMYDDYMVACIVAILQISIQLFDCEYSNLIQLIYKQLYATLLADVVEYTYGSSAEG